MTDGIPIQSKLNQSPIAKYEVKSITLSHHILTYPFIHCQNVFLLLLFNIQKLKNTTKHDNLNYNMPSPIPFLLTGLSLHHFIVFTLGILFLLLLLLLFLSIDIVCHLPHLYHIIFRCTCHDPRIGWIPTKIRYLVCVPTMHKLHHNKKKTITTHHHQSLFVLPFYKYHFFFVTKSSGGPS